MSSKLYCIDYSYKSFDGTLVEVRVFCRSIDVVKRVLSDVSDVGVLVNFQFCDASKLG